MLTLYWATGSFDTSFQQDLDAPLNPKRPTITVPVAVTQSHEWNMPLFPRSIADRAASDIRFYEAAPSGGHFMAFEEPQYVADRAHHVHARGRDRADPRSVTLCD